MEIVIILIDLEHVLATAPPVVFLAEPEKLVIDIESVARDVVAGKWSNGLDRKEKLGAWFYSIVQNRVNEICKKETGKNGTL